MPQAVFVAAGLALESSFGAFLITNSAFLSGAATLIGGAALSSSQQRKAKRRARDQYNAAQVNRLENSRVTIGMRELVLGRGRKGGVVAFEGSAGTNKTTYGQVVVLAAHEIDGLEQIYLNEVPVSLDGSGWVLDAPYASTVRGSGVAYTLPGQTSVTLPYPPVAGTVTAYTGATSGPEGDVQQHEVSVVGNVVTTVESASIQYQYDYTSSKARIRLVNATGVADARLIELFPESWTAAHRIAGCAYLVCEYTYDETAFPTGLPVVTAVGRYARVHDPRENWLAYSAQLQQSGVWLRNACNVDADVATDSLGLMTAERLTATGSDGYLVQDVGYSASTPFDFSLELRADTPVSMRIAVRELPSVTDSFTTITVGTTWTRYRVSGTTLVGTTSVRLVIGGFGSFTTGEVVYVARALLTRRVGSLGYAETGAAARVPGTSWTDNPALLARYVYQHPQFGKATISSDEEDRFIAAAEACDRPTTYVADGVATTQALYRAAIAIPFGTAARDALDDLVQAMAGMWAYAGGELYIRAGVWSEPVMQLAHYDLAVVVRDGDSETMHPIEIAPHRERAQRVNTVNVTIWDQAQDYKQAVLPPLAPASLVARDGVTLAQPVNYEAIGFAPQALHVAGVMLRDARDPLTVVLRFKARAYPLELFDIVGLSIPRYGWTGKPFMVLAREWAADGSLKITLKETAPEIYAVDATFRVGGYAGNTVLPRPWEVPTPGPLLAYSGQDLLLKQADGAVISRVRVTWPALADAAVLVGGEVEVQYRSVLSAGEWQVVRVGGADTQAVLVDVQDGAYYIIRARSRTALAVGQWSQQITHQVIGKTEPPPDVAAFLIDGLVLTWSYPDPPLDLAGFEIRFNYGSNPWWDSAIAVHEGIVTNNPYTLRTRPAGTITLLIKAVDTSGNRSVNVQSIVVDLGDIETRNVLLTWPQAPDFADGLLTGGAVVSGELRADSLDEFFSPGDGPIFTPGTEAFFPAGLYAEMQYTWAVTPSAAGVLLLEHEVAASSYRIEYLRGDQGAMFAPGTDEMFGPAEEPIFGAAPAWAVWPGSLTVDGIEQIGFRITTAGGDVQGIVSVATAILDVPDIVERVSDQAISAGGTRLVLVQGYREIVNVMLTVQADGGGGITARTEDKDPALGPLVRVFDASGTAVAGLIDATVQGY